MRCDGLAVLLLGSGGRSGSRRGGRARADQVAGPVSAVAIAGTEVAYADEYRAAATRCGVWDVATRGDVQVASHCFVSDEHRQRRRGRVRGRGPRALADVHRRQHPRVVAVDEGAGSHARSGSHSRPPTSTGRHRSCSARVWDGSRCRTPSAARIVVLAPNGSRKFALDAPVASVSTRALTRAATPRCSRTAASSRSRSTGTHPRADVRSTPGVAQSAVLAALGLIVRRVDGLEIRHGTTVRADPAAGRCALPRPTRKASSPTGREGSCGCGGSSNGKDVALPHARAALPGAAGAARPRVRVRPHARLRRLGDRQRLGLERRDLDLPERARRASAVRQSRRRRAVRARQTAEDVRSVDVQRALAAVQRQDQLVPVDSSSSSTTWIRRAATTAQTVSLAADGLGAVRRLDRGLDALPRAARRCPDDVLSTSNVPSGSAVKWPRLRVARRVHGRDRVPRPAAGARRGCDLAERRRLAEGVRRLPTKPSARPWISSAVREGGRSGAPMSSPACAASSSWSDRLRRKMPNRAKPAARSGRRRRRGGGRRRSSCRSSR